jgi:hypothetical protein
VFLKIGTLVTHFRGCRLVLGRFGLPSLLLVVSTLEIKVSTSSASSHPHHTISYQGGGDYRGIYDTGFKRGFYGVYRPFIECPLQDR